MVEWWQAILISLASAFMTGLIALVLQLFQHRHDEVRREREETSARDARREEAARQQSRDQARPFYEFLEIAERDQGRRLLGGMMAGPGGQRMKDNVWNVVRGVVEDAAWDEIWSELVAAEPWPPDRWQDVVKKYAGRFLTVNNVDLRDKLFKLMGHLAAREGSTLAPSDVSQLIVDCRGILANAIVDPFDLAK